MTEPEVLTEVPASLKRLAKQVVRGFYGVEHALALDILIRNPCVREEDMLELLKFDRKQLRSVLNTLKGDKFIKCRMRVETAPDGKTTRHNYYFINYRLLVNVVKYKLDHMRRRIETDERDSTNRASFKCPCCFSTFTDLEANQLFDPMTGWSWRNGSGELENLLGGLEEQGWCLACGVYGHTVAICPFQDEEEEPAQERKAGRRSRKGRGRGKLQQQPQQQQEEIEEDGWEMYVVNLVAELCPGCGAYGHTLAICPTQYEETEVEEDESALPKKDARTLVARFNDQIEPIYVLLRETEDINLSHDLLEPEPAEIPALKQSRERAAAAIGASAGAHRENWATKGSYEDFYTQNVTISMEEQEEQKRSASEGKTPKERPVWLTESTVKGAYSEADDPKEGGMGVDGLRDHDEGHSMQLDENEEVMRALLIHEKRSAGMNSVAAGGGAGAGAGVSLSGANASDSESDTRLTKGHLQTK
ncbi:UNVERIFIED_CONTAM: hypothetical protein FKN15_069581 [Acipenser sinensis]